MRGSLNVVASAVVGMALLCTAVADTAARRPYLVAAQHHRSSVAITRSDTTPPTLGNYPNISTALSTNTTVTPDAAPTNTTNINVSTSINFKGSLTGDPASGVLRITDAHPAGTYTVTVTAFNGIGLTTTKSFALSVIIPTTCTPVTFAPAVNIPVGIQPTSVAMGDFNRDGKQDLAVTNSNSNNVSILLGDGTGNFSPPANFDVGTFPISVVVGDFNGDGKQDLAVANSNSNNVSILLGDGAGNFSAATNINTGFSPTSLVLGDFNGDGKQDLAVLNRGSATVSILLGNGAGNFSTPTNFDVGVDPFSIAVGDFNGDGKQDLAVTMTSSTSNTILILLGDGMGNFTATINFAAGIFPIAVTVGDFNGDAKQDLVSANSDSNDLSVLFGDGAGNFSAPANFTAPAYPDAIAVGDFNGDGKQDLVATSFYADNVSILLGDGAGNFAPANSFSAGTRPRGLAVGDFDGDGKQDLVVTNGTSNDVSILLRICGGTPAPTATATATGTASPPTPTPSATPTPTPTPSATPTPSPSPTPTPGVFSFLPSKDNTLYYDLSGQLSNGKGPYLYAGRTSTDSIRRGLIAFDLTSIPANATVTSAILTLYSNRPRPNDSPVPVSLMKASQNWGEGNSNAGDPGGIGAQAEVNDATWLHTFYDTQFWTTPGGDFSSDITATTPIMDNGTYNWTGPALLADVQSWVTNPSTNHGWGIFGAEMDTGTAQRFNTRDNDSDQPRLIVTYEIATASPTPTPSPAKALNISTRLQVQTGNNVLIGGFIITGSAPKQVVVRGIGPSLGAFGVPDPLADPTLELRSSSGTLIIQNDNWQDDPTQASQLMALGLAPTDGHESALVATLDPNASYTAIVAGKDGGTGVGLVEAYDTNSSANSELANISTRGFVLTGSDVMIGGFILGGSGSTQVAVRGIGPSLSQFVNPALADPTLELHNSSGTTLAMNDNWQDDPTSAGQLTAHGLAPTDPLESGIFTTLSPGAYTAILAGKNGGTGIGLVEVYNVH
jgi:hypothetical protein